MIYQVNQATHQLVAATTLVRGFTEVSKEHYEKLQVLFSKQNLGAEVASASIDPATGDYVSLGGSFIAADDSGATKAKLDGKTGLLTAAGGSFVAKPTAPSAKGVVSPLATMQDINDAHDGIVSLSSPDGTLKIDQTDKKDVKITSTIATDKQAGVVKAVGGATGISINDKGELYTDGAQAPLEYIGTFDASKNEGGADKHKISDKDDENIYHGCFYVCVVAGTIKLEHGDEIFNVGDWALYESFVGDASKNKWVSVPISDATLVKSVNGRIGAIVLDNKDVGLDNVKNVDTTNATNITTGILATEVNSTKNITTTGIINSKGTLNAGITNISGKITFYKTVTP